MSVALTVLVLGLSASPAMVQDQTFQAPASLQEYHGRPVWSLLAGCARGHWIDAQRALSDVSSATEQAQAEASGTTVQAMRAQRSAASQQAFSRYGNLAASRIATDRQIPKAEALVFLNGQIGAVPIIETSPWSNPCELIVASLG